jgi:hypothetical protein
MSRKLSVGEKIEVLENVIIYLNKRNPDYDGCYSGLCRLILRELRKIEIHISYEFLYKIFPDFSLENAMKFKAIGNLDRNKLAYWWSTAPFDFDNRIKFVKWMIERIQTGKEGTDE